MRRIALVLMAAATFVVVVSVLATGPALAVAAQDPAEEEKEAKKAAMPKTGGISPENAAFLALGATALLVAGGLLVRRLAR
jgi:hypothetical protein